MLLVPVTLALAPRLGRVLSDAGISSFVVHGNHDPVETGWSALSGPWPELVTIFGTGTVKAVPVEVGGIPAATVQGVSFAQRGERQNLALRFAHRAGPGIQVGVLHCNVQGAASGYDDYSPCSLDDLRGIGLDYWALGHVHARMVLSGRSGSDEPWVVYPGNLQARSPKPSERGMKGAVVAHVHAGRVADLEPVGCDVVRFGLVEVDIGDIADLAELRARLEYQPFCWWDSIDDRSRPTVDIDAARAGSDFAADLIRLADQLGPILESDESAVEYLAAELSEGLPGTLRTRRVLEQLLKSPNLSPAELVDRALVLALGALEGDGH